MIKKRKENKRAVADIKACEQQQQSRLSVFMVYEWKLLPCVGQQLPIFLDQVIQGKVK